MPSKEKWTVYILLSKKDGKLYVGCTSDINFRIRQHDEGLVKSTAHRRPLLTIHEEYFLNKSDAYRREQYLKILWGAREKNKILRQFLEK